MLNAADARTIRNIYLQNIEERAASIAKTAKAIRTGRRYNDVLTDGERPEISVDTGVYYNEPGEKTLREALDAIEDLDYTFLNCFEV